MAWEIFTRKVQYRGSPAASFTKLGRLAFNKAATAKFERDAVENVLLLWNAEDRLIGVRPIVKKDTRAYKVHYGVKGNGCGFSAATFLNHIGFDVSETRTLPAHWDDQEEMFIIEVPEEYLIKNKQRSISSINPGGRRVLLREAETDSA